MQSRFIGQSFDSASAIGFLYYYMWMSKQDHKSDITSLCYENVPWLVCGHFIDGINLIGNRLQVNRTNIYYK